MKQLEDQIQVTEPEQLLEEASKPSNALYLCPIFLGLIGGLLGYIAIKDEDRDMAKSLRLLRNCYDL